MHDSVPCNLKMLQKALVLDAGEDREVYAVYDDPVPYKVLAKAPIEAGEAWRAKEVTSHA